MWQKMHVIACRMSAHLECNATVLQEEEEEEEERSNHNKRHSWQVLLSRGEKDSSSNSVVTYIIAVMAGRGRAGGTMRTQSTEIAQRIRIRGIIGAEVEVLNDLEERKCCNHCCAYVYGRRRSARARI